MEPGSLYPTIVVYVIALALSALYAFLETTIATMRLFKLKELAQGTTGYRVLIKALQDHPQRIFTSILIARSLADVAAATAGSALSQRFFGHLPGSYLIDLVLVSANLLIITDIVPKNIAKALGDKMFPYTLGVTTMTYYIFYPFVSLVMGLSDSIVHYVSRTARVESEAETSEKEVQFLIDYVYEHGLMEPEKSSMLKSIFRIGNIGVREIMVPQPQVVCIDGQTPFAEALQLFKKHQFSRLPVYECSSDNIVGMLYVKDLFVAYEGAATAETAVRTIMRPILFIPESIRVNQLLKEFKQQHMHLAMVLNEHGSIIGLVTLEDALEEIVGEIKDEHEVATSEKITALKHDSWLVDASVELDKLGSYFAMTFETEDAVTLSGFLIERLQKLPKKGDHLSYKGYTFQVQNATPKKIVQVLVLLDQEAANAPINCDITQ
jgi:putative hemolysin